MSGARDEKDTVSTSLQVALHELGKLTRIRNVDLVERDKLRALKQRLLALGNGVRSQLAQDDV